MNELLFILLDQQTQQEGGSAWSGMIMIVAMIVIFYFFMIRPQSKKQKELRKQRESMKKGDKVVTAGGIHGRIKDLNETIVVLEVAPGVSFKVDKASVFADVNATDKKATEKVASASSAGADLEEASGKVVK